MLNKLQKLKIYSAWVGLSAFACIAWITLIPAEGGGIFFGMSAARFALALFLFITGIAFAAVSLNFYRSAELINERLENNIQINFWFEAFAFLGTILGVVLPVVYALFSGYAWAAVVFRFLPLTTFLLALGLGYALFKFDFAVWKCGKKNSVPLVIFGVIFFVFLTLYYGAAKHRFGLTVDPVYWMRGLPVPVFPAQLGLLFLVFLVAKWIFSMPLFTDAKRNIWVDILICSVIWIAAFLIWSRYAVPNTYFSPKPLPPTSEVFPFSDARRTDLSSYSILTGEMGLNSRIPVQPFYALFIAFLHLLAGNQYSSVVIVQTGFLALIPVLIYLLGKQFSDRYAGLIAALLIIMKEANTLSVASLITTSNSKLYLTELPTSLILGGMLYLFTSLFKNHLIPAWKWLLAGGLVGVACMVRLQNLLLFFASLGVVIIARKTIINWKKSIFLVMAGFCLVVAPWLVRNYTITGSLVFEDPEYSSRSTAMVGLQISEKEARENVSEYSSAVGSSIQYMLTHPAQFIEQTLNHFTRNTLVSMYALPILAQPIDGFRTLLEPEKAYWAEQREPNPEKDKSALLIAFVCLGIGISIGFSTFGWAALLPFGTYLIYNLSSAIFRFSGWRYAQPVEWILLFYLALTMAWIIERIVYAYVRSRNPMESSSNLKAEIKTEKSSCMLALSFAILISLGVSLPLLSFIQPQFPKTTSHTVMAEIEQMEGISSAVKQKIRDVPVEFVYKGIALYPRFYEAGQGEPSSDVFYKAKDYARLLFVYLGSDRYNTELATDEIPFDIKNTSKIFIGGKMIENAFYAEWLIVDDQVASVYFSNRFR